jgi:Xaa-Pro aminopeptidase
VRIEDDVLVTPTGVEWLSGRAPRTTQEIERLMRGRR